MNLKPLSLFCFFLLSLIFHPSLAQKITISDYTLIEGNAVYDTVIIENGGSLKIGDGGMQTKMLMHIMPGGKVLGGYLRMHKNSFLINDAGFDAIDSLTISMFGAITIGGSQPSKIRKFLVGWRGRPLTLGNSIMITDTCVYGNNGGESDNPIITNGYDVILGANHKFIDAGPGTFIHLSGGKIIRQVAENEEIFIPVGDDNGQSNLHVKVNNLAASLGDSARLEITMSSGDAHPEALGLVTTDYLNRYFSFTPVNITSPELDAGFFYPDSDINGEETNFLPAFWNGSEWTYGDSLDVDQNFLYYQGISGEGDLSAGYMLAEDVKPCPHPINLRETGKSFTTIDLAWDAVSGVTSVTLEWKESTSGTWTEITGVTGNSYTLDNLTDNTQYDIRIKAICDENLNFEPESVFSEPIQVTTVFDNGCYPPVGLALSAATDTEATLVWNPVVPAPDAYWVEYRETASEDWIEAPASVTDTFITLTGLSGFTEYEFRVKTQCSEGVESLLWSDVQVFMTLGSCSEPFDLEAENFAVGAVIFRWKGDNDEFILQYRLQGETNWNTEAGLEVIVKMVPGLMEGAVYEWQVGGVCLLLGDTAWTTGPDILTLLTCDEVPSNLSTDKTGATGAEISWDPVQGITRYELKYRISGQTEWIEKNASSSNRATLFNLVPETEYEWTVRTWCEGTGTRSDYAEPVGFTTLKAAAGSGDGGINPIAKFYTGPGGYPAWTDRIKWANIIDMSTYTTGSNDFEKFENARDDLHASGGGVLYYPAGTYDFTGAPVEGPGGRGLMLRTGVVILGEVPEEKILAKNGDMSLQTIFKFKFIEKEPGKKVPADWNFIGIIPSGEEELKDVNNVGIAWVNLQGASVYFGSQITWGDTYATAGAWKSSKVKTAWAGRVPDGTFPYDPFVGSPLNTSMYEGAGDGRFVFGCQLDNSTVINNVIDEGFGENGYYVYKFGARIGVYGSNVFIANNRISKPDECFKYSQTTKSGINTIVFDYADVNSIDVNKMYLNINANKLEESGGYWEKGVIIADNWFYNHGRKGMDASGHWAIIRNNHNERDYLQEGDDVYGLGGDWELTLDGYNESGGASDNESRAYDLAGKALWIDGNSWNNTGSNPGNDGESILCQAHGGTQIHSWAVTRNKYATSYNESNKGYLSGYDVSNYGMLVAWNDTKGTVGNLNGKDGDQLIDCAFIPSGSYETVAITGDHSVFDTITTCPDGALSAPVNLVVTAVEDSSYIKIEWEDGGDNEIGFRIDRRESSAIEWTSIAYRPRKSMGHADNEQKWIDFRAVPGKEYEYRVVAVNCEDNDEGASQASESVLLRIQVAKPWFSLEDGSYDEAQILEISCPTPGAEIRYTKDGSEPDQNSLLYSAPFIVDKSMQVKAVGYLGNNHPSETVVLDIDIITGLSVSPSEGFTLFPNPAQEHLTLKMNDEYAGSYDISVIDLTGRTLLRIENLRGKQETISIDGLEHGSYFVKVKGQHGEEWIRKLIVY